MYVQQIREEYPDRIMNTFSVIPSPKVSRICIPALYISDSIVLLFFDVLVCLRCMPIANSTVHCTRSPIECMVLLFSDAWQLYSTLYRSSWSQFAVVLSCSLLQIVQVSARGTWKLHFKSGYFSMRKQKSVNIYKVEFRVSFFGQGSQRLKTNNIYLKKGYYTLYAY